jgi:hypothetical protein
LLSLFFFGQARVGTASQLPLELQLEHLLLASDLSALMIERCSFYMNQNDTTEMFETLFLSID